jgi:hypothetical protein
MPTKSYEIDPDFDTGGMRQSLLLLPKSSMHHQGTLTEREGSSTVDLFIKMACIINKENNVCNFKSS